MLPRHHNTSPAPPLWFGQLLIDSDLALGYDLDSLFGFRSSIFRQSFLKIRWYLRSKMLSDKPIWHIHDFQVWDCVCNVLHVLKVLYVLHSSGSMRNWTCFGITEIIPAACTTRVLCSPRSPRVKAEKDPSSCAWGRSSVPLFRCAVRNSSPFWHSRQSCQRL